MFRANLLATTQGVPVIYRQQSAIIKWPILSQAFWIPVVTLLLCLVQLGCQGKPESKAKESESKSPANTRSTPVANQKTLNDPDADYRVLFIGNSHSKPIPRMLTQIFKRQMPDKSVYLINAPGMGFLVSQARSKKVLDLIKNGNWDYVVLQAQKYSTTGRYTYPTTGSIELSKLAKESGAKILMYPEWSRQGAPDEYTRIRAIHDGIAKETGAQVAPIGEAWSKAGDSLQIDRLYADDGNHATRSGSYLNACVFYALITKESPLAGPKTSTSEVVPDARLLEKAAWETVSAELKLETQEK